MTKDANDDLPALNYAAPVAPQRLRIFVGVVLVLWSVFDLLSALFLCFSAGVVGSMGSGLTALLFVVLGLTVCVFAVLAIYSGFLVLKRVEGAAEGAHKITTAAEIFCWLGFGGVLVLLIHKGAEGMMVLFWAVVCLVIPGAVSVTRYLLKRVMLGEIQRMR